MQEHHIEYPINENRFGLEPMSIGTLLDRAFYFYRINFVTYLVYAAILTLPFTITEFLLVAFAGNTGFLFVCLTLLIAIAQAFATLALQGGIGVGTSILLFSNKSEVSVSRIWKRAQERLSPMIITSIMGGLLMIPLFFTLLIPPVGLAILTLYGIAIQLAMFVVLYEREYGTDAIRRAWSLICGSLWRVLGLLVLLYILTFMFTIIIAGGLGFAAEMFDNRLLLASIAPLSETLSNLFILPLTATAIALLYFDLRVRHEGLDVSVNTAKAAGEVIDLSRAPTGEMSWFTSQSKSALIRLSIAYTGLLVVGGILWMIIPNIFAILVELLGGF